MLFAWAPRHAATDAGTFMSIIPSAESIRPISHGSTNRRASLGHSAGRRRLALKTPQAPSEDREIPDAMSSVDTPTSHRVVVGR